MRYPIALFLILCGLQPARAQSLLDTLANGVCTCMQNEPEIIYPRLQATRCVNEVAGRYAPQIRRDLALSMDSPDDRRRLAELLIEPLAVGCPMLQELAPGKREPELHYSDFPLARAPNGLEITKHPPPDSATTTLHEGKESFRVSGTLLSSGTSNLELRLKSGSTLKLRVPARQLRRTRLSVGQPLVITYRYDWYADEKEAVPTVLTVE